MELRAHHRPQSERSLPHHPHQQAQQTLPLQDRPQPAPTLHHAARTPLHNPHATALRRALYRGPHVRSGHASHGPQGPASQSLTSSHGRSATFSSRSGLVPSFPPMRTADAARRMVARTSPGDASGWFSRCKAAAPNTCGHAIDVPLERLVS